MGRELLNLSEASGNVLQYRKAETNSSIDTTGYTRGSWTALPAPFDSLTFTPKDASSILLVTLALQFDHTRNWANGMGRVVYATNSGFSSATELVRGSSNTWNNGTDVAGNQFMVQRAFAHSTSSTLYFRVEFNAHPSTGGSGIFINSYDRTTGSRASGDYGGAFFSVMELNGAICSITS